MPAKFVVDLDTCVTEYEPYTDCFRQDPGAYPITPGFKEWAMGRMLGHDSSQITILTAKAYYDDRLKINAWLRKELGEAVARNIKISSILPTDHGVFISPRATRFRRWDNWPNWRDE
jgi:hypothetical protein